MHIEYTGRHYSLGDRIRDFTDKKLGKLSKFLEDPIEVHVILEAADKRRRSAELVVRHRHGTLQATEEAEEMLDAIHAVVDKAEKQARRSRKKLVGRRRRSRGEARHWPIDVLEPDSLSSASGPKVIKTTRLPIESMTMEEAAEALEASKNEFFVFLNSESEYISVLYKRQDGHYGLIQPES